MEFSVTDVLTAPARLYKEEARVDELYIATCRRSVQRFRVLRQFKYYYQSTRHSPTRSRYYGQDGRQLLRR